VRRLPEGEAVSRTKRERRQQKAELLALLRAVIHRLRRILKSEAPAHYSRFPDARRPCHSCAFNPGTDHDRGFDATVVHLVDALLAGRPFFCHEPLPYEAGRGWQFPSLEELRATPWLTERTVPCAGWWIVKDHPEARRAFARASADRVLSDAEADRLADAIAEMRAVQCVR
jgi:hypothetical protein